MTDTFDLRAELAEIPFEDEDSTAYFTTNFKLLNEVRELRRQKLRAETPEAIAAIDGPLAEKEADLEASKYSVEMMSVPRRRREDIYEEALDKFPARSSFIPGHVDEKTEFLRQNFVRVHIVAAAIKRMINPKGAVQEDGILDTVQYLHDESPDVIFDILERKAGELNAKGDTQEDLHKEADF